MHATTITTLTAWTAILWHRLACERLPVLSIYSTDAFYTSTNDIKSHYVDGVSITYCMATFVDIFGHMPLDTLMYIVTMVPTTVRVPSIRVPIPLPLLVWIPFVNLETLVYLKTNFTLKTLCGTVMDVVQATAVVHWLGCHGSVEPSHRK